MDSEVIIYTALIIIFLAIVFLGISLSKSRHSKNKNNDTLQTGEEDVLAKPIIDMNEQLLVNQSLVKSGIDESDVNVMENIADQDGILNEDSSGGTINVADLLDDIEGVEVNPNLVDVSGFDEDPEDDSFDDLEIPDDFPEPTEDDVPRDLIIEDEDVIDLSKIEGSSF